MKVNFGCGTNKLTGWENHDIEVDIRKPLPYGNAVATHVFAEHVVEHVTYDEAIAFFRECLRILRPSGICRIAVPSVVQVWQLATREYCEFASKWVPEINAAENADERRRGAMTNILYRHGHRAPWSRELLQATMWYAGFYVVRATYPGQSTHPPLRDLEGHGRVIGEEFNAIETVVVEGMK